MKVVFLMLLVISISLLSMTTAFNARQTISNEEDDEQEPFDFSKTPSELTSLNAHCDDSKLRILEPNSLAHLVNLEKLAFHDCKIKRVPRMAFGGLNKLKQLEIHTQNSSELVFERDSLAGLSELENLNIAGNHIRYLPNMELCNLPKLRLLNISLNEFASIKDLGIIPDHDFTCLKELDMLDLSKNMIVTLDYVPLRVKKLLLGSNVISQMHASALDQQKDFLQVLDLSNNHLESESLEVSLFHRVTGLRELYLSNNLLNLLEENIFDRLPKLKTLDLSGNQLESFSDRLIMEIANSLVKLDLSGNQIKHLNITFFDSLKRLKVLKLSGNHLEDFLFLPSTVTGVLPRLVELDLSHNRLNSFSSNGGNTSYLLGDQLKHLNLSHNTLSDLKRGAFENYTNIITLDLSNNLFQSVPQALRDLNKLQALDLSYNSLKSLNETPVLNMDHLQVLNLGNNNLGNISANLLSKMYSLQALDLSFNDIMEVEPSAFDSNINVKAIHLEGNRLKKMDMLFHNLSQLTLLDISHNRLRSLNYSMLPKNIQTLNISYNGLYSLGHYNGGADDIMLEFLDASHNELKSLNHFNIPDSIKTVLVNSNMISRVAAYTFSSSKNHLTKVDLNYNWLETIELKALKVSSDNPVRPNIFLRNNRFECDCNMFKPKSLNSSTVPHVRYAIVPDIDDVYCKASFKITPLAKARDDQFVCPYATFCKRDCQCCREKDTVCDCYNECPKGCACYYDKTWTHHKVSCGWKQLQDLPDNLPLSATEINFAGNNMTELNNQTFAGRKDLSILYLHGSHIQTIHKGAFKDLVSLTVLSLYDNELEALNGYEFETLSSLRELHLQTNQISSVHEDTFKGLCSLEVLDLRFNQIINFPVWKLALNPSLAVAKLSGNLWSCDCDYLQYFHLWMDTNTAKINDTEAIRCGTGKAVDNRGFNRRIIDFDLSSCIASSGGSEETC